MFLRPPDDKDVAYEFFAPFVMVPDEYEWCRIRSPTHGVFDCFIVFIPDASAPTVYVNSDEGQRFMQDRYPGCPVHRVPVGDLHIVETQGGRIVEGRLVADEGPVVEAEMTFEADRTAVPQDLAYGGDGKPVWGSDRWTCWGVDLRLDARVSGHVDRRDGEADAWTGDRIGVLTIGSFGRIAPLPTPDE